MSYQLFHCALFFVVAFSEEENGGSPWGGLVLFEAVDSNGGSLGGESSAVDVTLLSIPSLEVEEVRGANPITKA